jgi:hypothetical protein
VAALPFGFRDDIDDMTDAPEEVLDTGLLFNGSRFPDNHRNRFVWQWMCVVVVEDWDVSHPMLTDRHCMCECVYALISNSNNAIKRFTQLLCETDAKHCTQ